MNHMLRWLFFAIVVRPLMIIILGTNLRHRERIPARGPAIIVANHNSHLDVFALMHVLGLERLRYVRPVAAADYFLTKPIRSWFARNIVGIIPIDRNQVGRDREGRHPLQAISDSLDNEDIVLLFPEGTRGEPETMMDFQTGVAHLARRHPDVPVIPVFMRGLGKALPKGEAILVPFLCDIVFGSPLESGLPKKEFMGRLNESIDALSAELGGGEWA
ncbi:lysophospholipid acyltransferase family protein [Rhodopirellula sp. MGV]|uniref:lysophospholipid acyltransferase family protein n=1 Tax=Rhodopirellula sp. MGV TaxID=2023130 RepID=UPI000B97428E|nr:lysophospholipid acyltransferase family protein [Rhodopirellula sp. MGV]OYP38388.1 1-acyl-sn-glycerol-3-phosphate acyltransferase [Rhodopirellula sp. MGV]PNY34224.1 1-acyl-sn-glycerol-3-phosphate acyltransferase [Rhodopirellula baltica]